jgi:L-threo-3-deoxy-hexylosonate aldolase
MGEAHHLSPDERILLIKAARQALDAAEPSLAHVPIIAGTGAGSTRHTIELTQQAYEAGADCIIVVASGFFGGVLQNDRVALKRFWGDVANSSRLPVIIYNCQYQSLLNVPPILIEFLDPGVSGGIDLESDLVVELAAEHPNIIGIKLT